MSNIVKGQTSVEQPVRLSYTRTRGERTMLSYRGTEEQMRSLYTYYKGLGSTCDLSGGPVWALEVDVIGEDPEYSWEVVTEAQSVDILRTRAYFQLAAENRGRINQFFDDPSVFNYKMVTTDFVGTTTQKALALQGWFLKYRGLDNVTLWVPVMRTAYVVGSSTQLPTATTNVDVVHTTSTMIGIEAIPSTIWPALQDSYRDVYVDPDNGYKAIYNTGWIKGPPQVTHVGFNRISLTQEYRYAMYADDVYGSMV